MSEDDFSRIIGRNMCLQGTVIYYCSIVYKNVPYRKTTLSSLCFLTYIN